LIRFYLDWETIGGASGHECYIDDYEALCDMEELITDPEVVVASVNRIETYGGMVWDVTTIREFERGE